MTEKEQNLLDALNHLIMWQENPRLSDPEAIHIRADELLIEFIENEEIKAAYNQLTKWYA